MELVIKNFEQYDAKTLPSLFIMIEKELFKLKHSKESLFEPIELKEDFTINLDYNGEKL